MTVGLVIVSHSEKVALGAVELARQMTQNTIAIAAAGGMGANILGTSAEIIQRAIESVDSPDGVLILLDMGSAVLSTEMALEFLTDEQRGHVVLSYAPIIEGAVAGAIDAMLGHSLKGVKAAAEKTASKEYLQSLKPITEQEEVPPETEPAPPSAALLPADALEKQYTLTNPAGLHARPAGLIVRTTGQFKATIEIHTSKRWANANSMFELLALAARQGETIRVRAGGEEAEAALRALDELILANFYETNETPAATPLVREAPDAYVAQAANEMRGIATSKGVAVGPALLYTSQSVNLHEVERRTIPVTQVAPEQARLRAAIDATIVDLQAMVQRLQQQIGKKEAAIFDAQALLLRDPQFLKIANDTIRLQHSDAASAFAQAGERNAAQLESLGDKLLAERAVDIRDVTSRVVQHLGVQTTPHQDFSLLSTPVILIARDLTPSDTAQLRQELILGICTTQGGPTAHTAILARALGIPAIAGLDELLLQRIHNGDDLGMDAEKGVLYLQPAAELRATLSQRAAAQTQRLVALKAAAQHAQAPLLFDGRRIHLLANVGSAVEAEAARQWGAEGIGLLRTEFLFASAQTMPDEAQQRASYTQLFRAFRGDNSTATSGPIVVRTLDAGADKPMPAVQPFLSTTQEANPALGVRGLRVQLAHPELLEQQFRALLQAARDEQVELHVMIPMLTTVEELRTVRALFERVTADLHIVKAIPLGIMVEVPASVVMAPELAQLADFFSIGANDLLQYTLACDRTNTALASLYTPMQPSVLRLIRQVAEAGRDAGKSVAVCGEMASDPRLAPVLVGLGVTELSMTPNALPAIRAALTGHTFAELTGLADRVCQASTVKEVEGLCDGFTNT